MQGMPGLDVVRSKSIAQLSSIELLFKPGTDIFRARQLVPSAWRPSRPTLPTWAAPPFIMPPSSTTSRVMKIGVSSKTLSLTSSRRSPTGRSGRVCCASPASRTSPSGASTCSSCRCRSIPGGCAPTTCRSSRSWRRRPTRSTPVCSDSRPGRHRHRRIRRHPESADQHRARPRPSSPLPTWPRCRSRTSRRPERPPRRRRRRGRGLQAARGDAVINDGPGLLLVVEKYPWGNTLDVTNGVEQALAEMQPGLPDVDDRHARSSGRRTSSRVDRQPDAGADHRRPARRPRPRRVPLRVAGGADQRDRHSAVAGRCRARALRARRHDQRHGAGRVRDRARRRRRRRDHRRREHRAAPAPAPHGRRARDRPPASSWRRRSRCAARSSTRR